MSNNNFDYKNKYLNYKRKYITNKIGGSDYISEETKLNYNDEQLAKLSIDEEEAIRTQGVYISDQHRHDTFISNALKEGNYQDVKTHLPLTKNIKHVFDACEIVDKDMLTHLFTRTSLVRDNIEKLIIRS